MERFKFWHRWLWAFSILLILFGLAMVFLNGSRVFDLVFNDNINPTFWGQSGPDPATETFLRWIYSLVGAVITGWGIFTFYIVKYPFSRRETWAWNCVFVGLLVWYVLDTGASLYYGVFFNAGFNTLLFLLAIIPLIFTRKFMTQVPQDGG